MSASEALIELVKHSFLLDIRAHDLIASHFDRLARDWWLTESTTGPPELPAPGSKR